MRIENKDNHQEYTDSAAMKEIDKLKTKIKAIELQLSKFNIEFSAQIKDIKKTAATTHSMQS
jgi:hypothetical protein